MRFCIQQADRLRITIKQHYEQGQQLKEDQVRELREYFGLRGGKETTPLNSQLEILTVGSTLSLTHTHTHTHTMR